MLTVPIKNRMGIENPQVKQIKEVVRMFAFFLIIRNYFVYWSLAFLHLTPLTMMFRRMPMYGRKLVTSKLITTILPYTSNHFAVKRLGTKEVQIKFIFGKITILQQQRVTMLTIWNVTQMLRSWKPILRTNFVISMMPRLFSMALRSPYAVVASLPPFILKR